MGQQPGDRGRRRRAGRPARHAGRHLATGLPLPDPSAPSPTEGAEAPAPRPVTAFAALLQRWREAFLDPLFDVDIAWAPAVPETDGVRARLVLGPDASGRLRIEIDAGLTEGEAAYAALLVLAQVQLAEVQAQSRRLLRRPAGRAR